MRLRPAALGICRDMGGVGQISVLAHRARSEGGRWTRAVEIKPTPPTLVLYCEKKDRE